MSEDEEKRGLENASRCWNIITAFTQRWRPDLMDEMRELVPSPIKEMYARMGELGLLT